MKPKEIDTVYLRRMNTITEDELRSFGLFYTVLLSEPAQKLFWHLYSYADLSQYPCDFPVLLEQLSFTDEDFNRASEELFRYELLKVFRKDDDGRSSFVLEPLMPKTPDDFLAHPVLSRFFLAKSGLPLYTKIRNEIPRIPVPLEGYTEIRDKLIPTDNQDWTKKNEDDYQKASGSYELHSFESENPFDYAKFFENCSLRVFPAKFRTKENLDYIGQTAVLFGIDAKRMVAHVGNSMIRGTNRTFTGLDLNKLYQRCKDDTKGGSEPEGKSPYEIAPAEFLRRHQNGVRKLSDADARLLDDLMRVWKLPAPVINVLVEYTLETSNGELKRSQVEKIASSFVRADVKTAEDALKKIGGSKNTPKPAVKPRSNVTVKNAKPEEPVSADSEKEREELLKLLKG